MYKKLLTTTGANSIGTSQQRRIFRLEFGPYLGRMAALVQTSANEIKLLFADPPFQSWSSPALVANDADDGSFDAAMDTEGNIQVAYCESGTGALVTRRLTFTQGLWNVGAKYTVYTGAQSFTPSLGIEPGGKIWVAWCRYAAPNKFVQVKSSTDGGMTWGSGSADAGQELTTGNPFQYARLLIAPDQVHVIATYGSSKIVIRSLPLAGGSWSEEYTIASGSSGFTDGFDAAVRSDGLLAVVYNDTQFRYREFDGVAWGGVQTLNATVVESPQIVFRGQVPVVSFIESWSGLQKIARVTERSSGTFSSPVPLEVRSKPFDAVVLFDSGTASYQDVSSAAGNVATADVFHSASHAIVKLSGDRAYFGMDSKFRFIGFSLSTPGVGGTVFYSYWDGSNWRSISPASSSGSLDQSEVRILLWDDFSSVPADWQKSSISGRNMFWIKVEVQSAFATGPIGSHITAIAELRHLTFRR